MVSVVLGVFLAACGQRPQAAVREEDGMFVMDDFESGALIGWRAVGGGSGGWFVYTDGSKAPDPARSDANVAFVVPDPPRGRFAAVSDTNGPGTRILYRDVRLDGRFRLHLTVFYAGVGGLSSPPTLAYDEPRANQQFRIDLVARSAPIDSVAHRDVVVNIFKTAPGDPDARAPTAVGVDLSRWAGQTVRLRLAGTDNAGPAARRRGRHPLRADRPQHEGPDRASGHQGAGTRPEPRPAPDGRGGRREGARGPRRQARGRR